MSFGETKLKVELNRDQWKAVWKSIPGGEYPSPLKADVEAAGKATARGRFATEGTYYDFAEVVHNLGDCELSRTIALQMANELWSEVLAIRGKDA